MLLGIFMVAGLDWRIALLALVTGMALGVDSMCAAAVDATEGKPRLRKRQLLAIAGVFGIFHIAMPAIGYFAGAPFAGTISAYSGWISFAILGFLGLKGLAEQFLEMHVARMEKKAAAVSFGGPAHVKALALEVPTAAGIRKILRREARLLRRKDPVAVGRLCAGRVANAEGVAVYLSHEAKSLTAHKLRDLLHPQAESAARKTARLFSTVAVQAFATSLDALTVGFSYAGTMDVTAGMVSFAIFAGVVFVMCTIGGFSGRLMGQRFQRAANIAGALVLIAIGIRAVLPF